MSDASDIFTKTIKTQINGSKEEIPLLRWIFYFTYSSKMTNTEWNKNLDSIKKLLKIFARDFSDRGEYNAYKHALRFYNSSFALSIGITGSQKMHTLGASNDSITYLEEKMKKLQKGKVEPTGYILKTTKPFNFQRDFNCCLTIYEMINNIINTRKYSLLPELHGKAFQFSTFVDIDVQKISISKTGILKSSFTV